MMYLVEDLEPIPTTPGDFIVRSLTWCNEDTLVVRPHHAYVIWSADLDAAGVFLADRHGTLHYHSDISSAPMLDEGWT